MKTWLAVQDGTLRITLYVQPGARKTELAGEHDGALKIRLAAPPVDGKANAALVLWLAEALGVPRRCVCLVSGERSRNKLLVVDAPITADEVVARLAG
ncbi:MULTISPECIES: DUF167 domain-containing protein [Gulbenkiania]|uniref:UPF0235 protein Ga0061063_1888 n=2 Tax=Gulbenkiania TaxID=397456 RepID=A0A0K6GYQ2_9NEIS|nr:MULTISPECIES: DUF167 domain-containing protein [Gulbenkiania]TCW32755.1 hypothetical protein EV669_10254 [Gulbenkiania mobilis]CUA83749.1 Uncharacterized conserved protein YggU, UPF0235/DUF167 family [Gulbenkiania indica]